MARLNICGFQTGFESTTADIAGECGAAGGAGLSAATATIVTSPVRTGTYALRINPTTTNTAIARLGQHTGTGGKVNFNAAITYSRFYFRYATKPASGSEEICSISAAVRKASIRIDSAGKLSAWNQTGTVQVGSTGSTVLSANTWYCIEFKVSTSATVGIIEVRLAPDDGSVPVVEITGTGDTTVNNTLTLGLGKSVNRNGNTVDFFYADVEVDDSEYPGQGAIKVLLSTGDGTYTGWTTGSGNTEAVIDDMPHHDADTTYLQVAATGDNTARTFTMEDCATVGISGAIIKCVKVIAVVRTESITGASSVGLRLRSGSTDSDTTATEWTTAYQLHAKVFNTNPNGGAAWTMADVDGIEAGVYAGTIAQAQRCTAICVMVSYAPSVPVVVTPSVLNLSTASFVPQVKIGTTVTPAKLDIATTSFAPTVSTPRIVTPPTVNLSLTRFAPQIRLVIISSTKGLSTTLFEPKVVIGNFVTPSTKALTLTTFANTVLTPRLVTPGTKDLSLNSFAPIVSTPRLVVIGFDSVDITRFAPNVLVSGDGPVIGTASLVINRFAPLVVNPKSATPQTNPLSTTSFAPVVVLPKLATIGKLSMSVNTLTPTVLTPKIVTVPNSSLQVSTFIPVISSPKFSTPATSNMSLTSFQPQIRSEVIVGSSVLSLTAFNPRASTSNIVIVGTHALASQTFAPTVFNSMFATPLTKPLNITLYQLVVISSDALLVIAVTSVKGQSNLSVLGYTVDPIQGLSNQYVTDTFPFNDPPQGISNESVKGTKAL